MAISPLNIDPRPAEQLAPPPFANLHKQIVLTLAQIDLMRHALRRADRDFEQTGSVSCETMEFIRSVKGLIA